MQTFIPSYNYCNVIHQWVGRLSSLHCTALPTSSYSVRHPLRTASLSLLLRFYTNVRFHSHTQTHKKSQESFQQFLTKKRANLELLFFMNIGKLLDELCKCSVHWLNDVWKRKWGFVPWASVIWDDSEVNNNNEYQKLSKIIFHSNNSFSHEQSFIFKIIIIVSPFAWLGSNQDLLLLRFKST